MKIGQISTVSQTTIRFQAKQKFTQQELEQAARQMQAEREQERQDAEKVAAKLSSILGNQQVDIQDADDIFGNSRFGFPYNNPAQPINYRLVIPHSQYDPGARGYVKLLSKIPGIKVLSAKAARKFPQDNDFEWNINHFPEFSNVRQKIFPIRFEQYDAHASGW